MIDTLLIGTGLLFLVYGFFGLVGTWLVPVPGQTWLYGAGLFTGRLQPNRINRTLLSLWALFLGGFVAAISSGHRLLGYISFLAFILVAVAVLVVRYKSGK